MPETTIYVRSSAGSVMQAISMIPQEMMSGGPLANAMMTRLGLAVLSRIHESFVDKMEGSTDEAGDRWAPLKPETVAYSRRHRRKTGDHSQSQLFSRAKRPRLIPRPRTRVAFAPSYALTSRQRNRWWDLYRQGLAMHRGDKSRAARRAWFILKGEGATTLIEQYGGAKVDILRDTGLLLRSLTPGARIPEQVFRVGPGEVVVGTNRKGASAHHRGVPGRLPQRRLWSEPSRWPSSWWSAALEPVRDGAVDTATYLVRSA